MTYRHNVWETFVVDNGGMEKDYQAYLVRFQREHDSNNWRATLQNAHSQEVIQFATERELLLFLLRRLKRPLPTQPIDSD